MQEAQKQNSPIMLRVLPTTTHLHNQHYFLRDVFPPRKLLAEAQPPMVPAPSPFQQAIYTSSSKFQPNIIMIFLVLFLGLMVSVAMYSLFKSLFKSSGLLASEYNRSQLYARLLSNGFELISLKNFPTKSNQLK